MRTCSKCGREKELPAFPPSKRSRGGRSTWCRDCHREAQKTWYARTKGVTTPRDGRSSEERTQDRMLRWKYGITSKDVARMLEEQDGRCAACQVELKRGTCQSCLTVDHCHKTNRVRGLLCHACNKALGHAGDSPDRLRALAEYLENPRQTPD